MRKPRKFFWFNVLSSTWLAAALLAFGCGETKTDGGTDSNTHWLEPCDSDRDCGALSCVCGQCTRPCDEDAACGALPGASCAASSSCGSANQASSCVAECSGDAECRGVREDLECRGGQCQHALSNAGGADGAGGTATGTGGSTGGTTTGTGGMALGTAGSDAGSAGASGAASGACDAMDVTPALLEQPCAPVPPSFYFDGRACLEFPDCSCLGTDCGELYDSIEACDVARESCYETIGITNQCQSDADCEVTWRSCCEPCNLAPYEELVAAAEGEAELWHYCSGPADCDLCARDFEPTREAVARCVDGSCRLRALCEGLDAVECEANPSCMPMFGYPPDEATMDEASFVFAGCLFAGDEPVECGTGEGCVRSLDGEVGCLLVDSTCVARGWANLDCSDPACSPP